MHETPTANMMPVASRACLVSFHTRGTGGGAIASEGVRQVIDCSYKEVVDVFHDEECEERSLGSISIRLRRRRKYEMVWRLLVRGWLGGLEFDFAEPRGRPKEPLDLVVDGVGFADILMSVGERFLRTVVIHHNFEPDYYEDVMSGSPLGAWYVRAGRKCTRVSLGRASLNLFLTHHDMAKALETGWGRPECCVVLGFHERTAPLPHFGCSRSHKLCAIVTGNLSARKGYHGLVEFLHAARERHGLSDRVRFLIAGRDPTDEVLKFQSAGFVDVIGNPKRMDGVINQGDVYLNPNYTGSGIKVRNLDGLRNGIPVLCREENAPGFENLSADVFRTFRSVQEGLEILESIDLSVLRSERFRKGVWTAYASRFGLESGVRRFREIVAQHGLRH